MKINKKVCDCCQKCPSKVLRHFRVGFPPLAWPLCPLYPEDKALLYPFPIPQLQAAERNPEQFKQKVNILESYEYSLYRKIGESAQRLCSQKQYLNYAPDLVKAPPPAAIPEPLKWALDAVANPAARPAMLQVGPCQGGFPVSAASLPYWVLIQSGVDGWA